MEYVKATLRFPKPLWDSLHEDYAQSYPKHRLPFNNWLVKLLERMASK